MISIALFLLASPFALIKAQEGATPVGGITLLPSYKCDPGQCKLPKCMCASSNPPGNLDPKKIPQFITLTFDDSVNEPLWKNLQTAIQNHTNPNGCPLSATFFVSTQYTSYWYVQQLFGQGHEIATHTVNHVGTPSKEEINSAYTMLNSFAGIPRDKLKGFRTPFLKYNTSSFANVYSSGNFLYDSSIQYGPIQSGVWPHTLDFGPVVACATGDCSGDFKFPGLWEVPMYTLLNPDNSENSPMDPNPAGLITEEQTFELLKSNFLRNYNNNRLPMGIYLHAVQMKPNAIRDFITWTQTTYPDVYWINNQQLLSWVMNPTDIAGSLKNPALDCLTPATDPSNKEVCDGVDNNGDGLIDEGLVQSCGFTENGGVYFQTCFGCPSKPPTLVDPAPARATAGRTPVGADSCPNQGTFDPLTGTCVALKRMDKAVPLNGGQGSGANGKKTTSSSDLPKSLSLFLMMLLGAFALLA